MAAARPAQVAAGRDGLSVQDAHAVLNSMMRAETSGAIRRFQDWHRLYVGNLEGMDENKVGIILMELGRSPITSAPSRHLAWRTAQTSLNHVRRWMRNKKDWRAAVQPPSGPMERMPFIANSTALSALRYLDLNTAHVPDAIQKKVDAASLGWHLHGTGEPPEWWAGAQLDDEGWRARYMKPAPKIKPRVRLDGRLLTRCMVISLGGDVRKLDNAAAQTEPKPRPKHAGDDLDNEREPKRPAPSLDN